MFNNEKGHGEFTAADVYSVENIGNYSTDYSYMTEFKKDNTNGTKK
jgi:hypothetical protein